MLFKVHICHFIYFVQKQNLEVQPETKMTHDDDNDFKVLASGPSIGGSSNEYLCEPCNETFTSRSSWNVHKTSQAHLRRAANFQKFNCRICNVEFTTREDYTDHKASLTHRRTEEELNDRMRGNETSTADRKKLEVIRPQLLSGTPLGGYPLIIEIILDTHSPIHQSTRFFDSSMLS